LNKDCEIQKTIWGSSLEKHLLHGLPWIPVELCGGPSLRGSMTEIEQNVFLNPPICNRYISILDVPPLQWSSLSSPILAMWRFHLSSYLHLIKKQTKIEGQRFRIFSPKHNLPTIIYSNTEQQKIYWYRASTLKQARSRLRPFRDNLYNETMVFLG